MKKPLIILWLTLLTAMAGVCQTVVTPNPGNVLISSANLNKVGANMGTPTSYDSILYQNLIGGFNAGGEGTIIYDTYVINASASPLSATQFNINNADMQYDSVAANFWAGAAFTVLQSCNGASTPASCTSSGGIVGCTGTILSNTTASGSSPYGSTWTINNSTNQGSSGCASSFAVGDLITLTKTDTTTLNNVTAVGSGVTLETATVCPSVCGLSAFNIATSGSGVKYNFDGQSENRFRVLSTTSTSFTFKFWASVQSGTAVTVTPSALRGSGYSCAPSAVSVSGSTWAQYSATCNITDAVGTTGSQQTVQFTASGTGTLSVDIDNLYFGLTTPAQSTIFSDAYAGFAKTLFNQSGPGPHATLRYNPNSTGETFASWTYPTFGQQMICTGQNNYAGCEPNIALQDYLAACQAFGADPYIIMPVAITAADAEELVDFLGGSSGTTGGALRIALGGPSATGGYYSVFNTIHLALGNENWNGAFIGQNIGFRSVGDGLLDYEAYAGTIFTAMRGVASYNANTDLIMGVQQYSGGAPNAANMSTYSHPDSIEMSGYSQLSVSDTSTNALLFNPAFAEEFVGMNQSGANNHLYDWLNNSTGVGSNSGCGASHSAQCRMTVYEWNNGTGSGSITASVMQGFANGGAYGVVTALQGMLAATNTCSGAGTCVPYRAQNFFEIAQYEAANGTGYDQPIWGMWVDGGGASSITNAGNIPFNGNASPRPTALGIYLDNQAIIGPQISCPISGSTGPATYNLPANNNNVLAYTGVPHIFVFCFQSAAVGTNYAMMIINTDTANTYPITWGGSFAPGTNVTVMKLAPTNPTDVNEAGPVPAWTGQTAAAVVIATLTNQNLTSGYTAPKNSASLLLFSSTTPGTGGSSFTGTTVVNGNKAIN